MGEYRKAQLNRVGLIINPLSAMDKEEMMRKALEAFADENPIASKSIIVIGQDVFEGAADRKVNWFGCRNTGEACAESTNVFSCQNTIKSTN